MMFAASTHLEYSLESKTTMFEMDAPSTFRTPISLVRSSVVKDARPKSPRQAMKIARRLKYPNISIIRASFL